MLVAEELMRQTFTVRSAPRDLTGLVRQPGQRLEQAAHPFAIDVAARLADMASEEIKCGDRSGVRLRTRDPYLQAATSVDGAFGDSGGLTADNVADRDLWTTPGRRFLHRRQRVHGFPGLAYGHQERVGAYERMPVSQFGGVVHFGGNAGDTL